MNDARIYGGYIFIFLFCSNIAIHLVWMFYNEIGSIKLRCRKKSAIWTRNRKRELAFQERLKEVGDQFEDIKSRSFWTGMCIRLCCN